MTTSPATAIAPQPVDGLSDETRELVSRLPRETGWIVDDIYLYEGFWFIPKFIQGIVAGQKHFQARDTDVVVATSPKCGTTWLMAMTFALVNRPIPLADHPLLTSNPHTLVPFLETNLPALSSASPSSPRLFATHAPLSLLPTSTKDSSCKIVYICRDPKDALVSAWHYFNKLMPQGAGTLRLEDAFRMVCEGASPFGPFWDHVLGYWNESLESPHKVLFLKYEDVVEQPARHLRRLAEFLECPFTQEEESKGMVDEILKLCSFDHMSNLEVNKTGMVREGHPSSAFFRKGVVGDSDNFLTPRMMEELDRITQLKFRDSMLKF